MLRTFSFDVVTLDAESRESDRHRGRAQQFTERLGTRAILQMVPVPGGTFMMGAPASEAGSLDPSVHSSRDRAAVLSRQISGDDRPMARRDGRFAASDAGSDKSFRASGRQPVVRVSCDEAEVFCRELSRTARRAYRLPTEAEWEYACRAGTGTAFAFGARITRNVVNHDGEMLRLAGQSPVTMPVGSLGVANGFGLSEMHGSVWEWCQDSWHALSRRAGRRQRVADR